MVLLAGELEGRLCAECGRAPEQQFTGTYGAQRQMGNVWFKDKENPEQLDRESGANLTSLKERFDVTAYANPHSDVVALLIVAHQTYLHNLISRVNWETRLALHEQATA